MDDSNTYPLLYQNVDLTPKITVRNINYNLPIIEKFREANDFKRILRSAHAIDSSYDVVFIWDVEEITWLDTEYIEDVIYPGLELDLFSQLIKKILAKNQFSALDETPENDVVNIEDAVDDGTANMKRLAPKYALLEQFYNEIWNGMRDDGPIMNYELLEKCEMSIEASDLYIQADMVQTIISNRWKCVKPCLELVIKRSAETGKKYTNAVISDEGVGSAAAQLLVSGHAKLVPIENIYSTFKASPESVYERIRRKFGEKCTFVVVTSHPPTMELARKLNMLPWCVWTPNLIQDLYNAERDVFLQ